MPEWSPGGGGSIMCPVSRPYAACHNSPPPPLADAIVGDHPFIVALRDLVLCVARTEKGFTEINCAAIPGNLLERIF